MRRLASALLLCLPATLWAQDTLTVAAGDCGCMADYTSIPAALASLPSELTQGVVIKASGNLPESVTLTRFVSAGYRIKIVGPATIGPLYIEGPVMVDLDSLTVSAGGNWRAIGVYYGARVRWANLTVNNWTVFGLQVAYNSFATCSGPGTLTVTGPGTTSGWGVHIVGHALMAIWSDQTGCHINVSTAQQGFALGFSGHFTHQGPGGSTTISGANDALVVATDHSTWSTTVQLNGSNSPRRYRINSLSYFEAVGPKNWPTVGGGSAVQNSVAYTP